MAKTHDLHNPYKGATIGYYRVSTDRQATEGHAMERYRQMLLDYGIAEEDIYFDVESGGSDKRIGFNLVLDRLRQGAKRVVVPTFDRFQRSALTWERARQLFVELGIEFIELEGDRRPLDIESPMGILQSQFRAAIAEHTRNVNRWQSLQGHKYRRSKERPYRPPFPYVREPERLALNHSPYKDTGRSHVEIANEMIDVFLAERSLAGTIRIMAERYGAARDKRYNWDFPRDHKAFRRWLLLPTLRGHLTYFPDDPNRRMILPRRHEALIEPGSDRDRLIQTYVDGIHQGRKPQGILNPLAGICYCAGCGCKMRAKASKNRRGNTDRVWVYLFCTGAYPVAGKAQVCDRRTSYGLQVPDAVEAVIAALCKRSEELARLAGNPDPDNSAEPPEATKIRIQIEQLRAMEDPELAEAIAAKETRLHEVLAANKAASQHSAELEERLSAIAADPDFWRQLSPEDQREFFLAFVERVECDRGRVAVTLQV